jgi:uncharacterized Zn finger protein (UPF0148 family)
MNARIMLKACPRCRGDLCRGQDGEFSCLQCGYEYTPTATAQPRDNRPATLVRAA